MRILDEMRKEKLVVEGWLETLIQESSKPEHTQPEPEAKPKQKRDDQFTRSDPDGKIQKAIKKLKETGIRKNIVPYRPEIFSAITGKKDGLVDRKKDYEKETGMKLSTIKRIVNKIYKE